MCALLLVCGIAHAASGDLDTRRERALASFDAIARVADRAAIAQARGDLETVLAARPDDALARVHLGWLHVLAAREKSLFDARDAAEAGFREMDAAVAAVPNNPAVRLVRARCAAQMPLALGKTTQAEADFRRLVAEAQTAAPSETWTPSLRREVFFHAGSLALRLRRASDAVEWLEAAANVTAPTPSDADVQSMLALARRELSSRNHAEDPLPHDQGPAPAP